MVNVKIGDHIRFDQSGMIGTGIIEGMSPQTRVYYVRVLEMENSFHDPIRPLLHTCGGFFNDNVGWVVIRSGVIEKLPAPKDQSDIDLRSLMEVLDG